MKSIVLIGCYFGTLRKDFQMWLKSCKTNETINWIIYTNHKEIDNLPKNVVNKYVEFEQLRDKIQSKFDFNISLETPYKLCDYKVAYGYIFEEEIKEYDFWGYCDFDMIFGDIRKFITDDRLDKYDKFYYQGHLSIYKNTTENNRRFMKENENLNYKEVLAKPDIFVFDEKPGIYSFYKNNHWPMYIHNDYADITRFCKRLRLGIDKISPHENVRYQVFLWDQGKLYRVYQNEEHKIIWEELIYIHYSSRQFESIEEDKTFYITNKGFIKKEEKEITIKEIKKYNRAHHPLIEQLEYKIKTTRCKIKRNLIK